MNQKSSLWSTASGHSEVMVAVFIFNLMAYELIRAVASIHPSIRPSPIQSCAPRKGRRVPYHALSDSYRVHRDRIARPRVMNMAVRFSSGGRISQPSVTELMSQRTNLLWCEVTRVFRLRRGRGGIVTVKMMTRQRAFSDRDD